MNAARLNERVAPTASVIIPCFNAAATLTEQLEALWRQCWSEPFEVIFVDNASTDGSAQLALDFIASHPLPMFLMVEARTYKGAGYARNEGVAAASSERILFCDADDVVSETWVATMAAALERSNLIGGGREFRRLNEDWHPVAEECLPEGDEGLCGVNYSGRFRHVGAGNMGVRRSLFLALGGFDPMLPIHEDADFCIRAQLAGHELTLCPEAIVHIRVRQRVQRVFRQARRWGYWSVALWKKHYRVLGRPPVIRPLGGWLLLVVRVLRIRGRGDWVAWIYRLGWKVGRLYGSVTMGFLAL